MIEQNWRALTAATAVLVAGTLSACASGPVVEPASLVLNNGKIVTLDESRPEAQAMAVRGDTIVLVGSNDEVAPYIAETTQVIDLGGNLAIPGFIEGHGHFTGIGQARLNLNLMDATSWDAIVEQVRVAAEQAQPGEWILGRGWHQSKWNPAPDPNVDGYPMHDRLSEVSPDNPVLLTHASGHATFANAMAMELAGVTRATEAPEGGEIVRNAAGDPIGAFLETASGLLRSAYQTSRENMTPEEIEAETRRIIQLANEEVLAKGITSFQDAGSSFETIDVFRQVAEEGGMGVRLWVMVRDDNEALAEHLAAYRQVDTANGHLTVRGIKKTIDGALGSRGAWLLEPYNDAEDPEWTGLNTTPVEEVTEAARLAVEHGYQLCVHAIGDRANREVLDIYEAAFATTDNRDLRWRIEHAQHLNGDDIPRFAELGVVASMQGVHCTSDAPYVIDRLGEERAAEGAYVWKTLLDSGAVVTNGTDAPVEDVNPIASYYSTVSRRTADGSVFYPDQRLSREEALRTYTINSAFAAFEENIKGSLEPEKLADIVVLSQDILTIAEDQIPDTRVLYTIVGGEVKYQAAAPSPTD